MAAATTYSYVSGASKGHMTSAGSSYALTAKCISPTNLRPDVLSNDVQDIHMKLLARRALSMLHRRQIAEVVKKRSVAKHLMTTRRAVVLQTTAHSSNASARNVAVGAGNPFPYGQCTWWADQRYYQLHGVFVPWRVNANAWQWTARAYQFGWHVSFAPQAGDIMVLQPGVQGAYDMGHVGVVERVFPDGRLLASSMNWGANIGSVTDTQFHTGPGVAFISQ